MRSVNSACSKCSSSQREVSSPAWVPCSTRSDHASAMPCRRSCLSSTIKSRMVDLLSVVLRAQVVVASGIGQRRLGDL